MQLEFGRNIGYLVAAYAIVLITIGGYTASLIARWRSVSQPGENPRR